MREAMLSGIARVVPDVLTFATPIFADASGGYFSQRVRDDMVDGFDSVSVAEDVNPVSALLWTSVGSACIHSFEVNEGEFVLGSSARLAEFLKANEALWTARQGTAELVHRLIERTKSEVLLSRADSPPLVRTLVRERRADLARLSFVERSIDHLGESTQGLELMSKLGQHEHVLRCRTEDEFRLACAKFSRNLGFDSVWVLAFLDQAGKSIDYSPRWNDRHDPVLFHLVHQSAPIIWNKGTYASKNALDIWEDHAKFGMCNGIALALHLPAGRKFFVGVDRDQSLPTNRGELTRLVADLQLFAVYAQDVVMRILFPQGLQPERPGLTPRELEVLRWTMDGKTAWEVGSILGISERTAVLHTSNAMHKLECINKHQAVLKALRLGLIH